MEIRVASPDYEIMRVGGDESGGDWQFTQDGDGWALRAAGTDRVIRPSSRREAGLELA